MNAFCPGHARHLLAVLNKTVLDAEARQGVRSARLSRDVSSPVLARQGVVCIRSRKEATWATVLSPSKTHLTPCIQNVRLNISLH